MTDFINAGIVVTGAGHGIGRAIATRFARAGARVVVNDLDAAAAEAVAVEIGGHAVPGDAASEDGVARLVADARAHLGTIDVFCANAGVVTSGEGTEADWAKAFSVNVMAHVRAARVLLPAWLARGEGRFIVTASAAGLLTMLGDAPYSVSKHAAVAHAEWLAATYAHRGLKVHCICPQGVRTQLLDDTGTAGEVLLRAEAIGPEAVAEALWAAMDAGDFRVLPHPAVHDYAVARASDVDRWLRGMNRLEQRLEAVHADE